MLPECHLQGTHTGVAADAGLASLLQPVWLLLLHELHLVHAAAVGVVLVRPSLGPSASGSQSLLPTPFVLTIMYVP